jgi:His/Glu/Gln/Arg/opine family amino acid ABC transporter permease subunit
MSIIDILLRYRQGLCAGLWVTLRLCAIVWFLGLVFGSLIGLAGAKWRYFVGLPSSGVSFLLSGIPILVLLFWLHYPLQSMLEIVVDPFYTAAAALLLMNIFGVADIVRNAMRDFPDQYVIAARTCGLTSRQTFFRIKLPIILRQIIPPLLTAQVTMLQLTLFASLISVEEIFRVAQEINAQIYRPVEVYSTLAVFFLVVCLPLNGLALFLKHAYTRDLSER